MICLWIENGRIKKIVQQNNDNNDIGNEIKKVADKIREVVSKSSECKVENLVEHRVSILKDIVDIKFNSDLFKRVDFTVDLEELCDFIDGKTSKFYIGYELCYPDKSGWICVSDTFVTCDEDLGDDLE